MNFVKKVQKLTFKERIDYFVSLGIFIGSLIIIIILWTIYLTDAKQITATNGWITGVDTSNLEACDVFKMGRFRALFDYSYEYQQVNYSACFEICRSDDDTKLFIQLHPIDSEIQVFVRKDNPNESSIERMELANKRCYIAGITFSIFTILVCIYFCGCKCIGIDDLETIEQHESRAVNMVLHRL